jgi:hypothetical protein
LTLLRSSTVCLLQVNLLLIEKQHKNLRLDEVKNG